MSSPIDAVDPFVYFAGGLHTMGCRHCACRVRPGGAQAAPPASPLHAATLPCSPLGTAWLARELTCPARAWPPPCRDAAWHPARRPGALCRPGGRAGCQRAGGGAGHDAGGPPAGGGALPALRCQVGVPRCADHVSRYAGMHCAPGVGGCRGAVCLCMFAARCPLLRPCAAPPAAAVRGAAEGGGGAEGGGRGSGCSRQWAGVRPDGGDPPTQRFAASPCPLAPGLNLHPRSEL